MFIDDSVWNQVPEYERLVAFEELARKIDKDSYLKTKAERLRRERKRRDAFKEFVTQKLKAREVTYQTRWADFAKKIKDEAVYYELVGQAYPYISHSMSDHSSALYFYGGSTPREIFEDLID